MILYDWLGEDCLPALCTLILNDRIVLRVMPIALVAVGLGVFFTAGCDRASEPSPSSSPSSPMAEAMEDAAFMNKMEEGRQARMDLAKTRSKIVAQMKAMVDAKRAAMKGADDAAVKAALEKDPEWTSLYTRCEDLNAAIADQRRKMANEVRARVAPARSGGDTASPLGTRSGGDTASPLKARK